MKIGIALTSHNRPEITDETIDRLYKWHPENSDFVVVDDSSTRMPKQISFVFDNPVGVGVVKNKSLELLYDRGCTHFFLFDDDCRPLVDEWWLPYIESNLAHACWTFDRKLIKYGCVSDFGKCDLYVEYEKPNGCMLYFTRECIDKAGGWDLDFKGFGYEHVSLSDRIFNLGLTPARYIDVPNSKGLFELADCPSSFTMEQRLEIPNNLHLYQQKFYSKEFKPFK